MRDDFSEKVKQQLARRVGYRCSNPDCRRSTSGPSLSTTEAINMGVAAHITAASPGGARYDASMTSDARKSYDNGIWLCEYCGCLVDKDAETHPVKLLRAWKTVAEQRAGMEVHRLVSDQSVPSEEHNRIPEDARKLLQEADFSLKLGPKFLQNGKVKEHFLILDHTGPNLPHDAIKLETSEPSKRWHIVFDYSSLKHITWNKVAGTRNSEENPRHNVHSLRIQKDGVQVGKVVMDTNWSGDVPAEYLSYKFTYFGETLKEDKILIP